MKSHIFFDSKAISDRLEGNNSLIQNVVVSSAQHEREVEYHSNTDLCSHCKIGTVEIFQESGDYCLNCWQERTCPNI